MVQGGNAKQCTGAEGNQNFNMHQTRGKATV